VTFTGVVTRKPTPTWANSQAGRQGGQTVYSEAQPRRLTFSGGKPGWIGTVLSGPSGGGFVSMEDHTD